MTVYFVDDDELSRKAVERMLRRDADVSIFETGADVINAVSKQIPDVLITDVHMPGISGIDVVRRARELDPDLPIIVLSGAGDVTTVVESLKAGAYDYVEKVNLTSLLVGTLQRALERRRLTAENRRLRAQLGKDASETSLLGVSSAMKQLRDVITNVADSDAGVLIRGETGSGKEVVARELHRLSRRHNGPFVAINCGAVPENIFDSEMFGHEAGAFTGAAKRRIGKIEHASGGTLFLDEVDSMPLAMQVKLLRVLQERKIERLGSNELIDVDLRIVAASQKDLGEVSQTGGFRQDLFFRLNVIPLELPSLRQRPDDLPLLFGHFYQLAARRYNRDAVEPPPEFLAWLTSQDWPGNVRELQNTAERAVLAGFGIVTGKLNQTATPSISSPSGGALPEMVASFEKQLIEQELRRQKGSVDGTWKALQIPRKTLYDKFKKYGINRTDFAE